MALTQVQGGMISSLPTGSVLQVVQVVSGTQVSVSSTSIADIISAAITPKFSTSKILVTATINGLQKDGATSSYAYGPAVGLRLTDSANTELLAIFDVAGYSGTTNGTGVFYTATGSINYLHSPATTSSYTYKIRLFNGNGINSGVVYANRNGSGYANSTLTLMEIAA
jgi:hypothetical protein